ncbi:MAG: S8 family serine peptidase [Armatimonadota bacterium]|nr:S8 family serine peptidase [Armatimonadota bacterium]
MVRPFTVLLLLLCTISWADRSLEPVFTSHSRVLAAPDRIIVRFPHAMARHAAEQLGYNAVRDIPQLGYTVLKVPYGQVDETIAHLKAKGLVREAFPDRAYRMAYLPNDPLVPRQWNLFKMNVPAAWDVTQGSPEVVVAVLDTGVDYNHLELAPNVWRNPGEIPANGVDDDSNGFVDDDLGWDFAYGDRDPMDDHGHGTACAGIIAAVGDNGQQMAGVAYRCRVMCVKIGLSNGYSYDSMFAPGVVYAADMGAKVQSISYFSDDLTPLLRAAVDYAWSKGCLVIAAAGNFDEPFPIYPAGYDKAVAVAATTSADRKASFSTFGSWVDVSAPGVGIMATTWGGGSTDRFSGTSAATPNAAGVAALLWSLQPNAPIERIRAALEYSSLPLNDPVAGYFSNYGRVDAWQALNLLPLLEPWYPTTPRIHWISPHRIPATGGTVTIFGRGFGWHASAGRVLLQGRQLMALSQRRFSTSTEAPVLFPPAGRVGVETNLNPASLRPTPRPQPALQVLEWSDSRIVVRVPPGAASGWLQVQVRGRNSNRHWMTAAPPDTPFAAAPSDVGIIGRYGQGAQLSGGYAELLEADGKTLVARPRTDNSRAIELKLLVRGLDKGTVSAIACEYLRRYEGTANNPVESIQLYDFSSGSYPYGNWVEVFSAEATQHAGTTLRFSLPAPASRWVSYEGDLFVRIFINTGSAGARLLIDKLWFLWQ